METALPVLFSAQSGNVHKTPFALHIASKEPLQLIRDKSPLPLSFHVASRPSVRPTRLDPLPQSVQQFSALPKEGAHFVSRGTSTYYASNAQATQWIGWGRTPTPSRVGLQDPRKEGRKGARTGRAAQSKANALGWHEEEGERERGRAQRGCCEENARV